MSNLSSASLSKEEFARLRSQSEVIFDTFQSQADFGADMLLRHVKLKFHSESGPGYTDAISGTFVYCPDGRVRLQMELKANAEK